MENTKEIKFPKNKKLLFILFVLLAVSLPTWICWNMQNHFLEQQTAFVEREKGYTDTIIKLKAENVRLERKLKSSLGIQNRTDKNAVGKGKDGTASFLHPYKDTRYAKSYDRDLSERETRYGVSSKKTPFSIYTHRAGKRIDITAFENTVKSVYRRMPHVQATTESVALIVETAITESDMGRVLVLGDNYGVLQIQQATAQHLLTYLQAEHGDVYEAVEALRNKKYNLRWNLTHNVPYQIAMSITCYWHKLPNYSDYIATLEERATLWKSVYNTRLGKGTVEKYAKRVELAMK